MVELCFVQFHGIPKKSELSMDSVKNCLKCFRSQWQQTSGEAGLSTSASVYGLISVDSFRDPVPVVD